MAITNIDGIIHGMGQPIYINKSIGGVITGVFTSQYTTNGFPAAGVAPSTGTAGAALTSYTGQIPFTNPISGSNSYLARWELTPNQTGLGTYLFCDRLWHNSGMSVTSTATQAIASVAWPARDANGTINGEGVMIAVEVYNTLGAATPTFTMTYINSNGVTQSTSTSAQVSAMAATSFVPIGLTAGDTGVRKVINWFSSASYLSGSYSLTAYRVIATLDAVKGNIQTTLDAVQLGFPRMYDNTAPFLVLKSQQTTGNGVIMSRITYAQG